MRSFAIMRRNGCPTVFDATHSVQLPGGGRGKERRGARVRAAARQGRARGGRGRALRRDPPRSGPCAQRRAEHDPSRGPAGIRRRVHRGLEDRAHPAGPVRRRVFPEAAGLTALAAATTIGRLNKTLMDTFLIDVPMPSMGATVNELTVVNLKIQTGARVAKGQKIGELESDKSIFEFESPVRRDGPLDPHPARRGQAVRGGLPADRDFRREPAAPEEQVGPRDRARPGRGRLQPRPSGRRGRPSWPRRRGSTPRR